MTFWKSPPIHAATMLFWWTGLTAMNGSAASLSVMVPGGRKPLLQPANGLGCDSSTSGPSVAAVTRNGDLSEHASAMPARTTPNFFSAQRRVTD